MFWDKERIIYLYEIPEIDGDPYIRQPHEKDMQICTIRKDRETGRYISLWEEKLLYPYKTKVQSRLTVVTNIRTYELDLFLADTDDTTKEKCFIWNGSNIPSFLWSILKISKDSPQGLVASKWHDNLLYKRQYFLDDIRTRYDSNFTASQYRRFTSLIYRELLKKMGVNTIEANIMSYILNLFQFLSPQWWNIH